MKEVYDGYKQFYKEFCKHSGNEVPIPKNYKDTVLYILNETGLDTVQVEALSRYLGIGAFEDDDMWEPNALVGVGAKMNLSGAGVLQKITHLMYRCYVTPRRRVLEMGIDDYREMYQSIFGVSGKIMGFQNGCALLDREYEGLLKQAEAKRQEREERIEAFAKMYEISIDVARRLACKSPTKLSLPEIEEIFRGGVIERWYR